MDMLQAESQYMSSAFVGVCFFLSFDDDCYLIYISTNCKQIYMTQIIAVYVCTWQLHL